MQFTVVVPRLKAEPLAGMQVTEALPQLSVAVATNVTLLEQVPGEVLTVLLIGQLITGFSASFTVTVKLQLDVLP